MARLTAGHADVIKFSYLPLCSSFLYSAVTAAAPSAVSNASVNPSALSAARMGSNEVSPNDETNDGATDAITPPLLFAKS